MHCHNLRHARLTNRIRSRFTYGRARFRRRSTALQTQFPPVCKAACAPPGKLRLMYEANPMAWILEQAGGCGSTGKGDILDIAPASLHERVPVILGSREDVAALCAELAVD